MIGIYKITSPSGRVYIGQSIDITKRFLQYTRSEYKKQIRLKRSFEKYGINNHTFDIIETCLQEELNIRERYWQDFYNVLEKGLNCVLTETNELPKIMSKEIKDKISNSLLGKKRGKYKSRKNKTIRSEPKKKGGPYNSKRYSDRSINQLDLEGNIIKTWHSFQDIINVYPESEKSIWRCLSPDRQKTSIGFVWKFV